MKINSKTIMAIAVTLSLAMGNVAMAAIEKVAIVDVPAVVANSKQVKALKDEQVAKAKELAKWLDTVKLDVQKQSSEANKKKLLDKYNAELAKKKEANTKEYTKKLAEIDKNISAIIAAKAKAKGYDLVLPKGQVLFGGDDITAEIAKEVK